MAKIYIGSARKFIGLLTNSGLNGTLYLDIDEHNIISVVMELLRTEIFETELYGTVDGLDEALIHQIQKNMRNLFHNEVKVNYVLPCEKRLYL